MKTLKYIALLIIFLSAWMLMGVLIEYFELSRASSAFCGFTFALLYIAADKKIFKDW